MEQIIESQLFGVFLTIVVYYFASKIFAKFKLAILNPILISVLFIILILKVFKLDYESYMKGGSILNTLIVPATVALAIPLHKNLHLLKKNYIPIISGIIIGNTINCILIVLFCKFFKYESQIISSFIPKSITTAIAVGLSESLGGVSSITVALVVITGISGAVLGPVIFKMFNIKNEVAMGISLGSASHAVGTSKACEISETCAAMSGLAISLTGLYVIFIAPIIIKVML